MKRFISLMLAALLALCFVGCNGGEASGYVFKSGDTAIAIGGEANSIVDALGEYIHKVETPSCGGGVEPDREFIYSGFKFSTVNENGVNIIVKIVLTDDSVSTPEGVSIGDSREDVIAAYGDSYTESPEGALIYSDGVTRLLIGFTDGAVSAIHFIQE